MSGSVGDRYARGPLADELDRLASQFVARYRRGERVDVAEYADQYPELAEHIRDLFPALLVMERVRPATEDFPAQGPEMLADEPRLGQLGDFRVIREVGRGGMGIVYEAEQVSLGRHVALKVLPAHAMRDSRQVRRFRNEARSAARLHHTNIVPVFEVGEHEGMHFYAMQFISGIALDRVLGELRLIRPARQGMSAATSLEIVTRRLSCSAVSLAESLITGIHEGNLKSVGGEAEGASSGIGASTRGKNAKCDRGPVEEPAGRVSASSTDSLPGGSAPWSDARGRSFWNSVARIGAQCADALAYAHGQGIIHRDIKPANLLLDAQGNIWITDFGLARGEESGALTRTGDLVGTMRYMSPEQLEGRADAKSDLYSLGVTLYELITLHAPFPASERAVLIRQISDATPRRPRSIDARIPIDLETIVLKAMSRMPADRYAHAADMAADLRRFLEDRPIDARRLTCAGRVARWCRRNPVISSLIAAIAILGLCLSASLGLAQLVRGQRDEAVASRVRAEDAEAELQVALGRAVDAERKATILTHLARSRSWRNTRLAGQRTLPLEEIRKAAALRPSPEIAADLRNAAVEALARADLVDVASRAIPNQSAVQVDSRLSRYAVLDLLGSRVLTVFNIADDRIVAQLPIPDLNIWHGSIDWTPDGGKLIVSYSLRDQDYDVLQVWDVERREKIVETPFSCELVYSPIGVHPTGPYLAIPAVERDIAIWDLVQAREVRRFPCGIHDIIRVQFDRTGRRLAVTGFSGDAPAAIFDFATGQRLFESWGQPARGPAAFSPGGRLIAVGSGDPAQVGSIVVWDSVDERVISTLEGHTAMIVYLEFLHRDELIVSCAWDGTCRLWDVRNGDCLLTFSGSVLGIGDGDSQIALQRGNDLVLAELSAAEIYQRLSVIGAGNLASGLQPLSITCSFNQSDELAFGCDDQGVLIWDIQRGAQIASLPIGSTTNLLVQRSGKSLVTAGDAGILRWPITRSENEGLIHWKMGPPVRLRNTTDVRMQCVTWLNDQRQLAFSEWGNDQVVIIDADPGDGADFPEAGLTSDHRRISNLSASPDGRWLAASGWKEGYIQVWDVTRPSSPTRLPHSDGVGDTLFHVQFSPDNRRLVSVASNLDAPGLYIYETATWRRLAVIPGPTRPVISFSPDGTLACRQDGENEQLILVDGTSGAELARLPSPRQVHKQHEFSHDGRSLVFLSDRNSLDVIRLDRIGERLRELGLPWAIEVPPSPRVPPRPHEMSVDIGTVAGDYAKIVALRKARRLAHIARDAQSAADWQLALESYGKSVELAPDDPLVLNNYAWLLANCPDESCRKVELAVELSQRANTLAKDSAVYLNTLGVAQYRNGQFPEAIVTLERAEELDPDTYLAFNGFFLAMAHFRTGQLEHAHDWFQRSEKWMQNGRQSDPELIEFHREASSVLKSPDVSSGPPDPGGGGSR